MADDSSILLNIFPEELWLLILDNVKQAREYQNVCSISPYFRALLQRRSVQILFPGVFKVIYFELGLNTYYLLKLRRTCRSWRNVADDLLQNSEFFYLFRSEQDERKNDFKYKTDINADEQIESFEDVEFIPEFLKFFDPTHLSTQTNPFLGRAVLFTVPFDLEELPDFYRYCMEVLQKYGKHIWYCTFDVAVIESVDQVDFFTNRLLSYLLLMPYLRVLGVMLDMPQPLDANLRGTLESFTQANTFPTLPKLQFIKMIGVAFPIVKAILDPNPQIKTATAGDHENAESLKMFLEQLPNLTRLALEIRNVQDFLAFQSSLITYQITKLCLHASDLPISWETLFRALESQLSGTLTELTAELPGYQQTDITKGLNLANLRVLSLKMSHLVPLDFLLPLENTLEQLSVAILGNGVRSEDFQWAEYRSIIKLYQVWKDPKSSNVWWEFPKLRLLRTLKDVESYDWYSCTRSKWCRFIKY